MQSNVTLSFIQNRLGVNINTKDRRIEIPNTDRNTLAQMLSELSFNIGAEIGVEEGKYSKILLEKNPSLHLYAIDAWEVYDGYREHVTQDKLNDIMEKARTNLFGLNCELIQAYSVEASQEFRDESLDFVYIDGNHDFKNVANDLCSWHRKVKIGGIVAGHDYIKKKNSHSFHVPYVVDAFVEAYKIPKLFILGRKERIDGELRDRSRSWFYVKTH